MEHYHCIKILLLCCLKISRTSKGILTLWKWTLPLRPCPYTSAIHSFPPRASQAEPASIPVGGLPQAPGFPACLNLSLLCCFIANVVACGAEKSGVTNPIKKKKCLILLPPSNTLEIIFNFKAPLGQWTWVIKTADLVYKCRWTKYSAIPFSPPRQGENMMAELVQSLLAQTHSRRCWFLALGDQTPAQHCLTCGSLLGLSHHYTQFSFAAVKASIFL